MALPRRGRADFEQVLMRALRQEPVSFAINADQSSLMVALSVQGCLL